MDEKNMNFTKESPWRDSSKGPKSGEVDAQRDMDAPEAGIPIVAYFHNKRRQFSRSADLIEWLSEEERRI
jgi:hypothetical protein